jgi:MFS family permease
MIGTRQLERLEARLELASSDTEPPIDERASRRNRRVLLGMLVGIVVAGALIDALIGALSHHHRHHEHHSGNVVIGVIAIVVGVLFLVVEFAVIARIYRRPRFRQLLQYSWARRRRTARSLRRGQPVSDQDMPVAEALLRAVRFTRWRLLSLVIVPVLFLLAGLTADDTARRWGYLAYMVFWLLLITLTIRQRLRMVANFQRLTGRQPSTTHK